MNGMLGIYIFVLNSTFMLKDSLREKDNDFAREVDDVLVVTRNLTIRSPKLNALRHHTYFNSSYSPRLKSFRVGFQLHSFPRPSK
jgi:hypothetical protein